MDYRQFRVRLRKTARTWYVDSFGRLRQWRENSVERHCPLTSVSKTSHSEILAASRSLEMGIKLADWIAEAADQRRPADPHIQRRRQQLLSDCQPRSIWDMECEQWERMYPKRDSA